MRGHIDLNPYQIAYLCGGPERVAVVVLVALCADGQIKISPARHRVEAVRRAPRDPVEAAALAAIPDTGRLLRPTVRMIAGADAVAQIRRELCTAHLLPGSRISSLWRWGRLRAGRARRRRLTGAPPPDGLGRVAALGPAGIAGDSLRRTFETPDPAPVDLPKTKAYLPIDPLHSTSAPDRSRDAGGLGGGLGGW